MINVIHILLAAEVYRRCTVGAQIYAHDLHFGVFPCGLMVIDLTHILQNHFPGTETIGNR